MRTISVTTCLRVHVLGGLLASATALAAEATTSGAPAAGPSSTAAAFSPAVVRVVVCPGWAQVEREGTCQVQAGQSTVSFRPRARAVVLGSVRAWAADGDARVVGVQTSPRVAKEEHEAALRAAEKEVATLNQALDQAKADQEGAKLDLGYLEKLTPWQAQEALPKERAIRQITAAEVSELAEYLSKARTQALTRQAEAAQRQHTTEEELGRKQKDLEALRQRGPERSITVSIDLAASAAGAVRLAVSYTVPGASWYPQYLLEDGATPGDVRLRLVGVVQQATGEDWDRAKVTLSLLPPLGDGTWCPEDAGWLTGVAVALLQPPPEGGYPAPRPGWKEMTAAWAEWIAAKEPEEQVTAGARVRDNLAAAVDLGRQLGVRGSAWELACASEASVRADGAPVLVTAHEGDLTPKLIYHLSPATSARAVVTGRARNAWPVAWLPGRVTKPRLGAGAALRSLAFAAVDEEVEVPLGTGDAVTGEKRVGAAWPVEAGAEGKGQTTWPCRLIVRNAGTAPAEVALADCLPAAEGGAEFRLTESVPRASVTAGGRLTWSLTVPANGTMEVTYTVQAVFPADKPPVLLQSLLPRDL